MKKFTFLVIFISSFTISFSQTAWFWQNPLPQGSTTSEVKILPTGTAYATQGYTLQRTTNYGLNWNVIYVFPDYMRTISFINDNTGWAAGNYGKLLMTTNGGFSWTDKSLAESFNIFDVYFKNNASGLCVTEHGKVFLTTNAGSVWTKTNLVDKKLYAISFVNSNTGYIAGDTGAFYATTDGGLNWQSRIYDMSLCFSKLQFLDASTGYAATSQYGKIWKTTNGGFNWTTSISTPTSPEAINFINANTGFYKNYRYLFKTTDGSATWNLNYTFDVYNGMVGSSVNFWDANLGIATGKEGLIIRTTNAGLNWNYVTAYAVKKDLRSVRCVGNYAYAVGDSGCIARSTNNGDIWLPVSGMPSNVFFKSVSGYGNNVVAVGTGSTVAFSSNAGVNWSVSTLSPGYRNLNRVQFLDGTTAFIAGDSSKIFKSTNGGANWSFVGSSDTCNYLGLCFINAQTGFVSSVKGKVRKTTNGGISWTESYPYGASSVYSFYGIWFANENTGYVCGHNGTFAVTTNSGANWTNWSITYKDLYDISGVSPEQVFATGTTTLKYSNGEFTTLPKIYDWYYFGIHFINANTGTAVGLRGAIVKTTNGGSIFVGKESEIVPANMYLAGNYPNPFNPYTVIKFGINSSAVLNSEPVRLLVYDMLGRKVRTLVNETLSPGSYEVTFDASGLPSGVYFCTLIRGNQRLSNRIVLLK